MSLVVSPARLSPIRDRGQCPFMSHAPPGRRRAELEEEVVLSALGFEYAAELEAIIERHRYGTERVDRGISGPRC